MIICKNCGNEVDEKSLFCDQCGLKLDTEDEDNELLNNQSEETAVSVEVNDNFRVKKSKKTILFSLLSIVVLIGAIGGGYWYFSDKQEKAINKYREDLAVAVTQMMSFSLISEEICNQYSDVWNRAIKEDWIIVNNKSALNFNEAISYKREEFEEKNIIALIKKNTEETDKLMQGLNKPSPEYQNAYDKLVELYGLYTQYADLADFPKGSLLEFNKTRNQLSSEIGKLYKQFKILVPNISDKRISELTNTIDI
ncbi:hypothetical protein J2Z32_001060 [Paenibacillus turicensis]|uniref:Zinc-ribbon domain-containing protein n=1 Tax=Paenibacillus turicensis TaxID=160487 RepID=A0ABS4FPD0_9BACL|nr:zinc ribbon domain-containing protein [Paenibacillus turicensis]MBP1904443.1 hypothetical protein [Paenibacillus turicensis]